MHELSIAQNILQIAEQAAARESFRSVKRLYLVVPTLAGVEIDALRFALQSLSPETVLDSAEFVIDEPASRAHCPDCESTIDVYEHLAPCPVCGGLAWKCSQDNNMRVVDLLVE